MTVAVAPFCTRPVHTQYRCYSPIFYSYFVVKTIHEN